LRSYAGRGVGAYIENRLLGAEQYVLVCSPWISPFYAEKLIKLAEKGVVVKILTSHQDEPNHKKSLDMLKKALKPPRDWLGRVKKGWEPPPIDIKIVDERFIHAKIYAIDGSYAVVGSANLTEHGMWKNVEHLIIFEDEVSIEQIENDFGMLWQQYTGKEIIEEYKGRSIALSIFDRIFKR
jgi:phosphatidylserine/phosphatidylglycerophosphate/cardiolipin synthase-like enzyme